MSDPQPQEPALSVHLVRDLGLPSALAIGVGTMIAAGIFTLSGLAVRNVGSGAIVAFLMAALVAVFTALTYCEFASIYPRSGEGYLYARKTYNPLLAWFVGWCLWLGYCSSCAFYIASLSVYFHEFVWHTALPAASGLIALVLLTALNIKGTKESGIFQIVITAGKVALLCWFIVGGLKSFDAAVVVERFSTDLLALGSTAGMVFITFFGFSAIAASAGEVIDPVKNIPRAIFLSMGIVTVLYTCVVLVLVTSGVQEFDEAAMGEAAKLLLGPVGGMVIVGGALFSMLSASNASIMAGSRVVMAMSQHRHLPSALGRVNPRTHTPAVALAATGAMIFLFALALPLEDLAHFADTVVLLALVMVNAALILHRRAHPDIERPFRVPLVPLIPALGIVANIYLLSQLLHHLLPVGLALAALALGMVAFVLWKGTRPEDIQMPGPAPHVALERRTDGTGAFRILVPIANPDSLASLIDLAASIAKERDGEVVALRVLIPTEQLGSRIEDALVEAEAAVLAQAHDRAREKGVKASSLLVLGRDVAKAVLHTARDQQCDLIVMGWKGHSTPAERVRGEMTATVIAQADCDVVVMKRVGREPVRKLLLPTAGGMHAKRAERYATSLVRALGGSLTVCKVVKPDAEGDAGTVLDEARERLAGVADVHFEVFRNEDVVEGIVAAAADYDGVVIGAATESSYRRILFGTLTEAVSRQTDCTVIVVKRHEPLRAMLGRVMGE